MATPSEWAGPPVEWAGPPVSPTLPYLRISKVCLMQTGHRGYLSMHSAGFRFKLQLGFEVFSIIIHVIIAVASLFASMAIPGNSIDPL